ncbi:MAG: tetratricopeptide repeat protein [Spirochaetes bacterium]|jgi:tetratricopeptide (TPR) repeat protein|nr:tetratricopeptide repeat protein [Spirochaetota bacterium]
MKLLLQITALFIFATFSETDLLSSSLYFYQERFEESEMNLLRYLMRDANSKEIKEKAVTRIYRKNDILFCDGESPAALENNAGAVLMLQGDYKEAVVIFERGLKHAPTFFPFYYNLGKTYAHALNFKKAFLYLNKARYIVPEYFLTYLETGRTYESMNKISEAIEFYRKAAKLYPKHLETYIDLGNAYLKQNREKRAIHYYNYTLSVDPYYANGLLGKAKLEFSRGEFYKAYMTLRIIDTSKGDYDKAYHYYYAESCYKLKMYDIAYEQYEQLLRFKHDRFFIRTSISLIEHKMELSRRFTERKKMEDALTD